MDPDSQECRKDSENSSECTTPVTTKSYAPVPLLIPLTEENGQNGQTVVKSSRSLNGSASRETLKQQLSTDATSSGDSESETLYSADEASQIVNSKKKSHAAPGKSRINGTRKMCTRLKNCFTFIGSFVGCFKR